MTLKEQKEVKLGSFCSSRVSKRLKYFEKPRNMPIPTEKEILDFLSENSFVNFSKIARQFKIKNKIVPDVLRPLVQRKLILIEKLGSNKFVRMKK